MDVTDAIGHLIGQIIHMETELSHSHDQAIRLTKKVLEQANDEVDSSIERSLLIGSPDIAITFGYDLIKTGQMRGVQLARLLYSLDEVWDKFQTDDAIEDAVLKGMGISSKKFRAYRDLYAYVLKDHPELSGKPVGGLLGIITAAREGEFEEKDWEDLAMAHDKASLVAIRQRVRGDKTRGHARLVLSWDRDGYLWARRGRGEPKALGHLTRERGDDVIDAARNRILESAGIIQI